MDKMKLFLDLQAPEGVLYVTTTDNNDIFL